MISLYVQWDKLIHLITFLWDTTQIEQETVIIVIESLFYSLILAKAFPYNKQSVRLMKVNRDLFDMNKQ